MAVAVSYPGVYIQEIPSGTRAIAGVPTAIAGFVGYTARGPVNAPVQLFSYADFERNFRGVAPRQPACLRGQPFLPEWRRQRVGGPRGRRRGARRHRHAHNGGRPDPDRHRRQRGRVG
ncbi:MAG TPA: hypothetical protein ENN83_07405 [Rhodovulum sp.]|nr:hypothetical protein [Rhodovulum sp.]